MICEERSNPQSPILLSIVPITRPVAANMPGLMVQNTAVALTSDTLCQLRNQIPALMGPIFDMTTGDIRVADISTATDTVLAAAMWNEVYPTDTRYVIICPEKERTVK